ncbi:MAG: hypothetical protein WCK03_04695 [Candidatus Taylorbacteria bacterium]
MSRLITFGCSFTYGHGLPDCNIGDDSGLNPSKLAWPNLLSDKMNRSVVNLSRGGSGNTEMLWRLLNFDFQPDDFCVIMWSYFIRAERYRYLYDNINGVILPRDTAGMLEEEPMFTQNNSIKNLLAMSHASYYLTAKNISSYACVGPARPPGTSILPWTQEIIIPNCIKISNLDPTYSIYSHYVDTGLDKQHPGIKSHASIAESLYKKIVEVDNVLY